jgi:hypothetical protein
MYLDVVNHAIVAKFAPGAVSGRGKGIRRDVQQRAVAGVGDVERGNRDWRMLAHDGGRDEARAGAVHRVWSRRYRASSSPALLLTAPIPESSGGCGAHCRRSRWPVRGRRRGSLTAHWGVGTGAAACRGRTRCSDVGRGRCVRGSFWRRV